MIKSGAGGLKDTVLDNMPDNSLVYFDIELNRTVIIETILGGMPSCFVVSLGYGILEVKKLTGSGRFITFYRDEANRRNYIFIKNGKNSHIGVLASGIKGNLALTDVDVSTLTEVTIQ